MKGLSVSRSLLDRDIGASINENHLPCIRVISLCHIANAFSWCSNSDHNAQFQAILRFVSSDMFQSSWMIYDQIFSALSLIIITNLTYITFLIRFSFDKTLTNLQSIFIIKNNHLNYNICDFFRNIMKVCIAFLHDIPYHGSFPPGWGCTSENQ